MKRGPKYRAEHYAAQMTRIIQACGYDLTREDLARAWMAGYNSGGRTRRVPRKLPRLASVLTPAERDLQAVQRFGRQRSDGISAPVQENAGRVLVPGRPGRDPSGHERRHVTPRQRYQLHQRTEPAGVQLWGVAVDEQPGARGGFFLPGQGYTTADMSSLYEWLAERAAGYPKRDLPWPCERRLEKWPDEEGAPSWPRYGR